MTEPQMPAICPDCNSPMTRVVTGANSYLDEDDQRDVETGGAILGGERNEGQPSRACLKCFPEWAEVHRLACQDYEWQMAKEQAIQTADFQRAAEFRDRQCEIRGPLKDLVQKLVGD